MKYFFICFKTRYGQWQAQEEPQPLAAGVLLSLVAGLVLAVLPPLKSVAYQPLPLSWKPAAVICLLKFSVLQAGQVVSGSALIFCRTSFS